MQKQPLLDTKTSEDLLLNPYKLAFKVRKEGKSPEQILLADEQFMADINSLHDTHGDVLIRLVESIQATIITEMVENAMPVETVPLRHEIAILDQLLKVISRYSDEFKKRKKSKEGSEEESTEETPKVAEGEESSL